MKIINTNRKARYDYFLIDTYEVGIQLLGSEIKSIRHNGINLKECFVKISNDYQAYIINLHISQYTQANQFNHDETRQRKLLLHKKEIKRIAQDTKEQGLTIVPTKIYYKNGIVKLEIATAKGKKNYDKREVEKSRDANMQILKSLKNY